MLKLKLTLNRFAALAACAALGLSAQTAQAQTAAGTTVTNTVTATFTVGAANQQVQTSVNFLVDRLIQFTLTESATGAGYTDVAPGAADQVLQFTLANQGNGAQDFSFTSANGADPHGGTDSFDAGNVRVFVDNPLAGVVGSYDAADTATFVDELAAGASIEVFILADIPALGTLPPPAGLGDGDISAFGLTAQVAAGGGVGVQGANLTADDSANPDTAAEQIVFALAVRPNGQQTAADAYRVRAPQVSVTKAQAVQTDPVNNAANPKAIPGSVMRYTITITNAATATLPATGITVTDDLPAQVTYRTDTFGAGNGMQVTAPNIGGGAPTALSNTADTDEGAFDGLNNRVTISPISLNPGESATIIVEVNVN